MKNGADSSIPTLLNWFELLKCVFQREARERLTMPRATVKVPRVALGGDVRLIPTKAIPPRRRSVAEARIPMPLAQASAKAALVRCHVALAGERIAGWVRSLSIGEASWCDSLFVEPEFRRRGIGRALVAAMLRTDRTAGHGASVLAARHAGARLYAAVGYQTIGTILVFNPPG